MSETANEKDREDALKIIEIWDGATLYVDGTNKVSDEIARIRSEAVNAERERCADIACKWFYGDQKGLAVDQLREAIQSSDTTTDATTN